MEIKKKDNCNLCCRRPSVNKSHHLFLKISLKNLKNIQDYQYFQVHSCGCHYCWLVPVCFSTAAYVASYLKILSIKKLFNTWKVCTVLINFSLLQIISLTFKLITYCLANTTLNLSLWFALLLCWLGFGGDFFGGLVFFSFPPVTPPAPCKKLCTLFLATAAAGEKPHLASKHA